MNVLIISKVYYPKPAPAVIQIRRFVEALIQYGNCNITIITEENNSNNTNENRFEIIGIRKRRERFVLINRVIERFLCNIFCIKKNYFIKCCLSIARESLLKKPYDLLLTISTPFDAHIVGKALKFENPKLKWITIFSDMWPLGLLPKPYYRRKILAKLERNLMKDVLNMCDGYITPTEYTVELIQKYFNPKAIYKTIPHCSSLQYFEKNIKITGFLVHSGSLQKERISEELIEAIAELSTENSEFKGLIQLGNYDSKLIKLLKHHKHIKFFLINRIPEELAIMIQRLVEVGIIIEAPMKEANPFMPSKISDIILNNNRLVAITPKKSFLRDFAYHRKGFFCANYQKNEIKEAIINALRTTEYIEIDEINFFHPLTIAKEYEAFFIKVVQSE